VLTVQSGLTWERLAVPSLFAPSIQRSRSPSFSHINLRPVDMDTAKATTQVGSVPVGSRAFVEACASRCTLAFIAAVSVLRQAQQAAWWEGGTRWFDALRTELSALASQLQPQSTDVELYQRLVRWHRPSLSCPLPPRAHWLLKSQGQHVDADVGGG